MIDIDSIQKDLWYVPMIKSQNPLYLRADTVVSERGALTFNEIELIEPSFYLDLYPQAWEKILMGIEKRI